MIRIVCFILAINLHISCAVYSQYLTNQHDLFSYNKKIFLKDSYVYRCISQQYLQEEVYEDECDIFAEALKEQKNLDDVNSNNNNESSQNTQEIEKELKVIIDQDKTDNINEQQNNVKLEEKIIQNKDDESVLGEAETKDDLSLNKYYQYESDNIVNITHLDICILDKYTGKRYKCRIKNEESYKHYNLYIHLTRCVKNINPFNRDVLGFFNIYLTEKNMGNKLIFSGWISKLNPCVSNIANSTILISVLN